MRGTKAKALRRQGVRTTKPRRAPATGAQLTAIEARIAEAKKPYSNLNWEKLNMTTRTPLTDDPVAHA